MRSSSAKVAAPGKKRWRRFLPFPRRKTLRRIFPGFEQRKVAHLIASAGTDMVLDIGANTGQYAQGLRSAGYKGRILSFEPLPQEHAGLTRLAARDPGWEIAPRTALGRETGQITIHRYADSSLSSALRPAAAKTGAEGFAGATEVETPLARLDDLTARLCRPQDRLFLKIDVQGMEPEVIAGAPETLARAVGVQVELALTRIYEGEPGYLDVLKLLHDHGFTPVYFLHVTSRRRMTPEAQMDAVLLRTTGRQEGESS